MAHMGIMQLPRYYIKTRGIQLSDRDAVDHGIKRIYNYTSSVDYMDDVAISGWVSGLADAKAGEAILVENAFKFVGDIPVYVSTCIVFHTVEQCNVYYMRYRDVYKDSKDGFICLWN